MKLSKLGLGLSLVYVVICVLLISTQGLFGESFIALILGMPWVLFLSVFEFGGVEGMLLYILIFAPMVLNAVLLYFIGAYISPKQTTPQPLQ